MGTRPRRVTTADVARESGVSRATVSYVLNDVPGRVISTSTRELVLKTAQRLGHVPHGPARALRSGRSNLVLALVRDYSVGYIADRLIAELDRALSERGVMLVVQRYDESVRPLPEIWGLLSPDLVVAMAGLDIPPLPEASPVRILRVQGTYPHDRIGARQVDYLVGAGHTRIAYAALANPRNELVAVERLAGALAEAERLGLPPVDVTELALGDAAAALAAVDRWTSGPDAVTAVCAHNDEIALVLLSALRARGLRPKEDLAVIGVDDIPIARVEVTTIEIDVEAYIEVVVDGVTRALDGEEIDSLGALPDEGAMRLIVRDTA